MGSRHRRGTRSSSSGRRSSSSDSSSGSSSRSTRSSVSSYSSYSRSSRKDRRRRRDARGRKDSSKSSSAASPVSSYARRKHALKAIDAQGGADGRVRGSPRPVVKENRGRNGRDWKGENRGRSGRNNANNRGHARGGGAPVGRGQGTKSNFVNLWLDVEQGQGPPDRKQIISKLLVLNFERKATQNGVTTLLRHLDDPQCQNPQGVADVAMAIEERMLEAGWPNRAVAIPAGIRIDGQSLRPCVPLWYAFDAVLKHYRKKPELLTVLLNRVLPMAKATTALGVPREDVPKFVRMTETWRKVIPADTYEAVRATFVNAPQI